VITPRRLAFAAFCTAAAAIIVAWWLRKPRVEEAPVARRTVHPVISGRGTIRPSDQVDAFPRVIGRVSRVLVNVGQRVRKEQTIAELDGASYAIQVEEASAAVERAALE